MKQYLTAIFWLVLLGIAIYYSYNYICILYKSGISDIVSIAIRMAFSTFLGGVSIAALTYEAIYTGTSNSLEMYKRELEKEAIDKTENSSRVKVLESKIQVLEKALDEALKK